MFLTVGVCAILVVAIILEECEWYGWSTILCIGAAAFAHFTNIVNLLEVVRENAVESLAFVGAYVVAGVLWSFCKWFFYLLRIRDYTREAQEKFRAKYPKDKEREHLERQRDWEREQKGADVYRSDHIKDPGPFVPPTNAETQEAFVEFIQFDHKFSPNVLGSIPKASDNKKRLVSWMALWPVSLVGTLLNDPVRRLFNWIFSRVKGVYQKMANALFKEFAPKQ